MSFLLNERAKTLGSYINSPKPVDLEPLHNLLLKIQKLGIVPSANLLEDQIPQRLYINPSANINCFQAKKLGFVHIDENDGSVVLLKPLPSPPMKRSYFSYMPDVSFMKAYTKNLSTKNFPSITDIRQQIGKGMGYTYEAIDDGADEVSPLMDVPEVEKNMQLRKRNSLATL